MSFNLEVTITGLCVFRPEPAPPAAAKVMDVLMLELASPHPRHYPRVFYDAAYDSSTPAGTAWRRIALDDAVLDLSGFAGPGGSVGPITDLVDTGALAGGQTLPQRADEKNNQGKVLFLACRVTLPPGSAASPSPTGPWELQQKGPPPTTLKTLPKAAWHVVWTVTGIPTDQLDWELRGLRDAEGQPLVPLHPIPPKKGKIKLLISNVVREESKPQLLKGVAPATGKPMPHFDAYQHIYGAPGPWPELVYMGNPAPPGSGYSCLPSGGK